MARRRKQGARTKSGRLSRAHKSVARDLGTSEIQRRRQAVVGEGNDPNLAASMADRYYARMWLEPEHRVAVIDFRKWYCIAIAAPWPPNSDGHGYMTDSYYAHAWNELRRISGILGRRSYKLVRDFAVYETPPPIAQRGDLRLALDLIS